MIRTHDGAFNDLPHDNEVVSRARAIFRSACEDADSYHMLRLGLARRRALNAGASRFAARVWTPLAGAAVACCALAVGIVWMRPISRSPAPANVASSAPISAEPAGSVDDDPNVGSSQMDLVQHLDFYRWLAAQPTAVATTPGDGP